jgi:transposase InsO family protein
VLLPAEREAIVAYALKHPEVRHREFAETLAGTEVGHRRIRPHTPTDNAEIEPYQRTIGERIDEHDLEDYDQAHEVIGGIIHHYNHHRPPRRAELPAAGGLLSREPGGAAGRTPPETGHGQGTA